MPNPDTWWQSAENHIGNGPFNIASIDEEQRWTFAANENYWQGRPKLDGIEYRYVEDAAVALEAYRAGELDIVQLEPPQIPEVQADPELSEQLLIYPTASTYGLQMNLNLEPFNDLKVREAFAYAFDRETYCAEIRSGDCTPTLSWIPLGFRARSRPTSSPSIPKRPCRLWPSPPTVVPKISRRFELYYNSERSGATERSEWMAGQYRDILGIELDPPADRRHDSDVAYEGQRHLSPAHCLRWMGPGLSRPAELAQRLLDM